MITRRGWMAAAGSAAAMVCFSGRGYAFGVQGGVSAEDELCCRAWHGLRERTQGRRNSWSYVRRLRMELAALTGNPVAVRKLLTLSDIVMWARRDGIPVGPGRGAAPGSLVCWALGITGVDPIRYDLVFERFYLSAKEPLVDLHVCSRRRDELLDQLVANRAEATVAVRQRPDPDEDVYVGVAPWRLFDVIDRNRLALLVRELRARDAPTPRVVVSRDAALATAYDGCPEVRRWCEDTAANPDDPTLWPSGRKILVSSRPFPTSKTYRSWPVIDLSAYQPSDDVVEFDLTGHEILSVLGADSDAVSVTDTEVRELLASGANEDVYQLEDMEVRRLLQRVEPESFEDVAAAIALYRPGPIEAGWAEELVAARHGRRQIDPMHPTVAAILAPTRGLLIYQEQLIRVVAELSGMSLATSNQVRRDLGARRNSLIKAHRENFVEGAGRRGCSANTAHAIFSRLERDAGYTFSRAHAIAETTLTLRSARHVLQPPRLFATA